MESLGALLLLSLMNLQNNEEQEMSSPFMFDDRDAYDEWDLLYPSDVGAHDRESGITYMRGGYEDDVIIVNDDDPAPQEVSVIYPAVVPKNTKSFAGKETLWV